MRTPLDRYQLFHGPYRPPALRLGDRATCLFRDGDVIITGWGDAPIPRPHGRRLETHGAASRQRFCSATPRLLADSVRENDSPL
jgi:hypothetical protein